jgi:hypothetical protein
MTVPDEAMALWRTLTGWRHSDLSKLTAALDDAYRRGFDAGRAEERRDVVAYLVLTPRAMGVPVSIESSQDIARLAKDIENAAHLDAKEPT